MGELYKLNDDKELNEDFMRARRLTRLFNSMTEEQMEERKEIIKELFKSTGENVHVEQTFHCDYGCHISVGENFYANYDCIMVDVCEIIIGDNVLLAPRVGIYTAGHPIDAAVRNEGLEFGKPVIIGEMCIRDSLYGDLDISVSDELPANRLPIKNCVVDTSYRNTAYTFMKKQVREGRQCYVICTMVEESEQLEVENVLDYAACLLYTSRCV